MSPFYDIVGSVFTPYRKLSVQQLNLEPGSNVLIIGAGTGLDLQFIPKDVNVVAIDITPAMINRLQKRNNKNALNLTALVMDGQQLQFADKSFDKVILHLILAVMPIPVACAKEAERVLKDNGRIVVYDKFISASTKPGVGRTLLNFFTNILFSNINRKLEDILAGTTLTVVKTLPGGFGGQYQIYVIEKSN